MARRPGRLITGKARSGSFSGLAGRIQDLFEGAGPVGGSGGVRHVDEIGGGEQPADLRQDTQTADTRKAQLLDVAGRSTRSVSGASWR